MTAAYLLGGFIVISFGLVLLLAVCSGINREKDDD